MTPSLTIIIPVRNRQHCIAATLDSIAASTVLPACLLVVDNGSTDATADVVRQWAAAHAHGGMDIRMVEESRAGAGNARNRGLEECATEYVYFFDSDDLFGTGFIEQLSHCIAGDGAEADIILVRTRQCVNGVVADRFFGHPDTLSSHIIASTLSTQSVVYRTAWLRRLGGSDVRLRLWIDWELGVRVLLQKPATCVLANGSADGQPVAYHTIFVHPDSITGPSLAARGEALMPAFAQVLADINSAAIPDGERRQALLALRYRANIVAGQLAAQRNGAVAHELRRWVDNSLPAVSAWHRMMAALLRAYTSLGGRGAWRIALRMC